MIFTLMICPIFDLGMKLNDVLGHLTPTCWQMLAYLANTLAFSKMASSDGVVSLIFSTLRHLAKSAPSFLYCAQRSDSPSRPTLGHRHTTAREEIQHRFCSVCEVVCVCVCALLPWVVVSPFVPASGTTPLSTCKEATEIVVGKAVSVIFETRLSYCHQ